MSNFDATRYKLFDFRKRVNEEENASITESWTELAPSRGSLSSSIDLGIDKLDRDSRHSPSSISSPHIEYETSEAVKYKLLREMLPPGKNTDWIWDWSSRPESLPSRPMQIRQYGSNLTTPPNSPEPEMCGICPCCGKNKYNDNDDKVSTFNLVLGVIVHNIFTLFIGAAIGFAVCKKFVNRATY